jgi:hypothetical protein
MIVDKSRATEHFLRRRRAPRVKACGQGRRNYLLTYVPHAFTRADLPVHPSTGKSRGDAACPCANKFSATALTRGTRRSTTLDLGVRTHTAYDASWHETLLSQVL